MGDTAQETPEPLVPRGYQLEMLRMSTERNIIVAMDTGSGKTFIAALRIEHELQRCATHKRVWFLCPTIALANQQRDALASTMPSAFSTIVLSSTDGVDHWSSRAIWNRVLDGVSVVVCTYQVLLDALKFGFVPIDEIALLVFDEAHHCHGKHPAHRILMDHYHPARREKQAPCILGLTASPVQKMKDGGLQAIEASLNAIARTPKDSRDELLRHVHLPELAPIFFDVVDDLKVPLLYRLRSIEAVMAQNMMLDPWVIYLRPQTSTFYQQELRLAVHKGKTWCQDHISRLCTVAESVFEDLGQWATHRYLSTCVSRIRQRRQNQLEDDLSARELQYLSDNLVSLSASELHHHNLTDEDMLSPKLEILIATIVREWRTDTTAMIFVKTRNAVHLLCDILSNHPGTRPLLRIGTFVGLSAHPARGSELTELIDAKGQERTLDHLRSGEKNLLISTSVCEEGIDVSACNLVICFEAPSNLRAFIQRRGRARSSNSKYMVMLPENKRNLLLHWKLAEEEMKQQYMDDMREVQELERLESDEEGYKELTTSKAKLLLEDAIPLLQHFCSKLADTPFTPREPIYTFTPEPPASVQCSVLLPSGIAPSLRKFHSATWKAYKQARQDAAFEAVSGLYKAGLLDEHLMPALSADEEVSSALVEVIGRPSITLAEEQYDPLPAIAAAWERGSPIRKIKVLISVSDGRNYDAYVGSPFEIDSWTGRLFIDVETTAQVSFKCSRSNFSYPDIEQARKVTRVLLAAALPSRTSDTRTDFPLLCVPASIETLREWLDQMSGVRPATTILHSKPSEHCGLVRDSARRGAPYYYLGTEFVAQDLDHASESDGATHIQPIVRSKEIQLSSVPEAQRVMPMLKVKRFSRRADFLHEVDPKAPPPSRRYDYADPSTCSVDHLPSTWASFAAWLPSIFHMIHMQFVIRDLKNGLLQKIPFDQKQLLDAISASSARNGSDYQRLEFLGDSLLSTQASLVLISQYPLWPEGYLSRAKALIVSNKALSQACLERGLSKYIVTKAFTGAKWRPAYNGVILEHYDNNAANTREMSTKTLADVVEALLGAAWVSAGDPGLLKCLSTLLPHIRWESTISCLARLQQNAHDIYQSAKGHVSNHYLQRLSRLVGHDFAQPGLIQEAMTHPSYNSGLVNTPSYQRLEFLGDSILESLVTTRIFSYDKNTIAVGRMHSIRTAVVNGDFLAFCAMTYRIDISRTIAEVDPELARRAIRSNSQQECPVELLETKDYLSLPSFLRRAPDATLSDAMNAARERFEYWSPAILTALTTGSQFPWTELAAFRPEKLFSDLVESSIAALAVDQGYVGKVDEKGKVRECAVEAWLERLGVLTWLDKMLEDPQYTILHPKEQVGIAAVERPVRYEHWIGFAAPEGMTIPAAADESKTGKGADDALDQPITPGKPIRSDGFVIVGQKMHCYNIYVGERKICSATGTTRLEAETRVAERAVGILRAESVHDNAKQLTAQMDLDVGSGNERDTIVETEDEFFDAERDL